MRPQSPILTILFCVVVFVAVAFGTAVVSKAVLQTPDSTPTPDPATAKVNAVRTADREANSAISAAEERRLAASSKTAALDDKCKLTTISEQTTIEFQQLAEHTISASQPSLPASLTDAETKLKAAETKLKAAKDALPTAEPLHPDVTKARTDAQSKLDEITRQLKLLDEEKTKLNAVLPRGLTCAQGLITAMSDKIGPLKSLDAAAKGDASLPVLNQSIPDLITVITLKQRLSALWGAKQPTGGLMRALVALGKTEADVKPVTDGLNTLDTDLKAIATKLKPLLTELSAYAKLKQQSLVELSKNVVLNPAMQAEPAQSGVKAGTRTSAQLTQLNAALGLLEAQLGNFVSVTDLQAISDADAALVEETRRLGVAVTLLQDSLGGSFEKFEADQVSLFYFTDVPRLMQALNPSTYETGGIRDARERADQARRDLAEAELTLANAQGSVSSNQRRLEESREELRQAQAQFLSADGLLTTASRKLDELKARPNPDQRRITESEQRKSDLQAERDAAKERQDELSNEQSGLPAKIREARNDLIKAQEKVRETRANILRLALAESEAFARARDNTPFWVALPVAGSTDPAKRVLMYAFSDSKTLFLRGNKHDLVEVRKIINGFDRPSPQARMTLWTLELNSTADKSGTESFNRALQSIEAELSNTRARIATSLSFLRQCINNQVNKVADEKLQGKFNPDATTLRWARLHFYQLEVLLRLGFDPRKKVDPTMVALGPSFAEEENISDALGVAHFTLPDPAATTTLGEALMVLALASRESREAIAKEFKEGIEKEVTNLKLQETITAQSGNQTDPHFLNDADARFAFIRKVMGLDQTGKFTYGTTSAQQEIVRAIQAGALPAVIKHLGELTDDLLALKTAYDDALHLPTVKTPNRTKEQIVSDGEKLLRAKVKALDNAFLRRLNIVDEIIPIQGWLANEIGLRARIATPVRRRVVVDYDPNEKDLDKKLKDLQEAIETADNYAEEALASINQAYESAEYSVLFAERGNPLREANARVAAADQMLKEMIIAVEDDLDRHFVQPMMVRIRTGLVKEYKGIGVGIVQRTSVLATNRTLARVEARGTAQIALGEETDILQGIQQLANLIMAGQTAGPLGILGGLNALPRRDSAELYGLTTGGTFKVTPIFDPSGQALRFQLDQVSATMIREPDGTVNPQLPRVERHTVNTEVQLSNMELREVSRFNANARLGIPTRTWGGLPLFNSFPWVRRNVPLFGWFVRKKGDAPFVQQSLIFGQTTMYPTIGDIMDLFRNPDSSNDNGRGGQREIKP
jgi:hypothetical protein